MVRQSWQRLAISVTILMVCGCPGGGDFEIPLPHGYFIARVQLGHFVLVAPDRHTIVLRAVRSYFVENDMVVGELAQAGGSSEFFILDTRSGALNTNLRSEDWGQRVRIFGITEKSLHEPHPADAIFATHR